MKSHYEYYLDLRVVPRTIATGLFLTILITIGCSEMNQIDPISELSETDPGLILPNVSLQISYDQKSMVFTPYWPEDMTAELRVKQSSEDAELLIDYDHTKEIMAIDGERNLHFEIEYLEGSNSQGMPDDLFNDVKLEMPNREGEEDIIKTTIGNGELIYTYKDGSQSSFPIDQSELQITQEAYDYWYDLAKLESDTSVEARISRSLMELNNSGIQFNRLDNSTVYFELKPEDSEQDDIAVIKQKLDLKTGQVIMSASQFSDGRYESVSYMNYKTIGNMSVLSNSETYVFGSYNGLWQATQKHVVNRDNIQIKTKF